MTCENCGGGMTAIIGNFWLCRACAHKEDFAEEPTPEMLFDFSSPEITYADIQRVVFADGAWVVYDDHDTDDGA